MSTVLTQVIDSGSSATTEQLGQKLGANCLGGEVIELTSDLGGGKTTFVRGLARGLGSADHVSSPTFKISNIYEGKSLTLYHYDFYRLAEAGLMVHELHDALEDPNGVVVIEWGGVVADVLPEQHLRVELKRTGDDTRKLNLSYPEALAYLVEGIC